MMLFARVAKIARAVLIAAAVLGTFVSASIAGQKAEMLPMLGRWHYGPVYASAVFGSHVFFGSGGVLRVLRISEKATWTEVTAVPTDGVVRDMVISGDHLFIVDESGSLLILDISKPEQPREVGRCDLPRPSRSVSVQGDYAYVAAGWTGLVVIDVCDHTQPKPVAYAKTPSFTYDVALLGSLAFLSCSTGGLQIVDITDPVQPREISSYSTPGLISYGVFAKDAYVFVVGLEQDLGEGGLRIFDVSDPTQPQLKGSHQMDYGGERVWANDQYAYIAGVATDAGLIVLDVTDPTDPRWLGRYHHPTCSESVTVDGPYAYLAHGDMGLEIIDITKPTPQLPVVHHLDAAGLARAVHVTGSLAYLANGYTGLRIIDISNPQAFQEVGHIETYRSLGVQVVGNLAYVADDVAGLKIINVTNPREPQQLGAVDTVGESQRVAVSGSRAYLAAGDAGLRVIDITQSMAPMEIAFIDTPGYAWDVSMLGDLAGVADGKSGLRVIRLPESGSPIAPIEVGHFVTENIDARGVHLAGNHAYVAAGRIGIIVIDLSDPARLTEVGRIDTPASAEDIHVMGNHAYVAGGQWIRVYDISTPSAMVEIGASITPSTVKAIWATEGGVYVAGYQAGLMVFELPAGAERRSDEVSTRLPIQDTCATPKAERVCSEDDEYSAFVPLPGTVSQSPGTVIPTAQDPDDNVTFAVVVSGAGASEVNGVYNYNGKHNGAHQFEMLIDNGKRAFEIFKVKDSHWWNIMERAGADDYPFHVHYGAAAAALDEGSDMLPPSDGWGGTEYKSNWKGLKPGPVVQAMRMEPKGGSGVIESSPGTMIPTAQDPDDNVAFAVVVSGAGSSEVNGAYNYNGKHNGAHRFEMLIDNGKRAFEIFKVKDSHWWNIMERAGADDYPFHVHYGAAAAALDEGSDMLPPSDGWGGTEYKSNWKGLEPGPVVQIMRMEPKGGSGVIESSPETVIPTAQDPDDNVAFVVVVSGAGSSEVNGAYNYNGEHNGAHQFEMLIDNGRRAFEIFKVKDSNWWNIMERVGAHDYPFHVHYGASAAALDEGSDMLPPSDGWGGTEYMSDWRGLKPGPVVKVIRMEPNTREVST